MSIATVITEGFGNFSNVNFVPTEGYGPYDRVAPSFNPLATHGGQGRRRWDHDVRRLVKGRPDDEVLDAHVMGLVAHLLGIEETAPAAKRAASVLRDSVATIDALETAQWELAETRAIAAILESKVAGLERIKARLKKQQEDEEDDDEAIALIVQHA